MTSKSILESIEESRKELLDPSLRNLGYEYVPQMEILYQDVPWRADL